MLKSKTEKLKEMQIGSRSVLEILTEISAGVAVRVIGMALTSLWHRASLKTVLDMAEKDPELKAKLKAL